MLIENIGSSSWNVRKISVDITYTLAILMPEELHKYKKKLMEMLNVCRFDKIKNVRDSSIAAINVLKEL